MTPQFQNKEYFSALSIAGSDPSGGAGVQMDLKTFSMTGVWGMAVITALTAQNAAKVTGSWPIEPKIVKTQIQTVFEDMTPGAVKTGMLANSRIIKAVDKALPTTIPLVVDPVMVSTSGYRLLDEDAVRDIRETLTPRAHLITPNIPEAEILANMTISCEEEMLIAGKNIIDLGAQQVIIKGGHGTGNEAIDLLIRKNDVSRFSHARLPYEVHGSGCAFSAAITGYIAQGFDNAHACEKAKELISNGIKHAISGTSGFKMIQPLYR